MSALVLAASRIGAEAAGPAAAAVDREARFPHEAFAALRKERLLSCFVPAALGGQGCSLEELSEICTALGQHCTNTAMIFAMHQIQVACLVRHSGQSAALAQALRDLCERQLLVASATTETGIGGDVRTSSCAVERRGERFALTKSAPVISYAEHCDAILVTARRAPESAPSDQVAVLVRKSDCTLERISTWDTLGMRGTCSLGFKLTAEGPLEHVLPVPYAEISAQTMLPVAHLVWSSLWLGLATSAVHRARAFVRGEARKKPGTTVPGALRLAEVMATLQTMRASVHDAVRAYAERYERPDELSTIAFTLRMNNLKVSCTQLAVQLVHQALLVCGLSGYRNDSPFSLNRHLRDSFGAVLMISNDRILHANANFLQVYKDD